MEDRPRARSVRRLSRRAARCGEAADGGGFDTVWTYDHFSGLVQSASWSRDPFVTLGAIAASTERINVGVLVANVANRHPAQLACARQLTAITGAGDVSFSASVPARLRRASGQRRRRRSAAQSSPRRHVGRYLPRRSTRCERSGTTRRSPASTSRPLHRWRSPTARAVPPIIVGASSRGTIRVACEHADGVNLLPEGDLAERVAFARDNALAESFEVSAFLALDPAHPIGGDPTALDALGVDRRTLYASAPFPVEAVAALAKHLDER